MFYSWWKTFPIQRHFFSASCHGSNYLSQKLPQSCTVVPASKHDCFIIVMWSILPQWKQFPNWMVIQIGYLDSFNYRKSYFYVKHYWIWWIWWNESCWYLSWSWPGRYIFIAFSHRLFFSSYKQVVFYCWGCYYSLQIWRHIYRYDVITTRCHEFFASQQLIKTEFIKSAV